MNTRTFEYIQYARYLKEWDWEWLVTLTFSDKQRFGPKAVVKMLLRWTRELCTTEHIQVGYSYTLSYICGHPHLHLLMIGYSNSNGNEKTLHTVSRRKWERAWPYIAKIEIPKSRASVAKYLATHKLRFKSDKATIDFYNIKLLRSKRRRESEIYPVNPDEEE